jgi:hypothetical protein
VAGRADLFAKYRRDDAAGARRRCLGPYADGIDALRKALPENAEYIAAEAVHNGAAVFVRSDLAPRRAWYLGTDDSVEAIAAAGRRAGGPERVVVSYGYGDPPRLITAEELYLGVVPPR